MRRLFNRADRPPEAVRAAVGGRVLASAVTADGRWLVGTRDALALSTADGGLEWSVRWEHVLRAEWDDATSTLRVEEVRDYGEPVALTSVALDQAALLLQLVRERVTASITFQRRVELGERRGLTVVARRPPAGGELVWAFQLDPGVDPEDPAVRAAADAALVEAREAVGAI